MAGSTVTLIQQKTLNAIHEAGAAVGVFRSVDEWKEAVIEKVTGEEELRSAA